MKEDAAYLHHILECIRRIEGDVAGGWDRFMASHTLQDAVLRSLQTMAESTQRLSDALKGHGVMTKAVFAEQARPGELSRRDLDSTSRGTLP